MGQQVQKAWRDRVGVELAGKRPAEDGGNLGGEVTGGDVPVDGAFNSRSNYASLAMHDGIDSAASNGASSGS